MNGNQKIEIYQTTDLWEAATLICKGADFIAVKSLSPFQMEFHLGKGKLEHDFQTIREAYHSADPLSAVTPLNLRMTVRGLRQKMSEEQRRTSPKGGLV